MSKYASMHQVHIKMWKEDLAFLISNQSETQNVFINREWKYIYFSMNRVTHKKDRGLEASQIRIFNDTPMKFSGYHPDIMGYCLLSNTEVVTSYFVILSKKRDIFTENIYIRESKNLPVWPSLKNTMYTINQYVLVWLERRFY